MRVQSVYVPIDLVKTRMQYQRGFLTGELHNTYMEQSFWTVIRITQVNSDICFLVDMCVCVCVRVCMGVSE